MILLPEMRQRRQARKGAALGAPFVLSGAASHSHTPHSHTPHSHTPHSHTRNSRLDSCRGDMLSGTSALGNTGKLLSCKGWEYLGGKNKLAILERCLSMVLKSSCTGYVAGPSTLLPGSWRRAAIATSLRPLSKLE